MRLKLILAAAAATLMALAVYAGRRPFREYPGFEHEDVPLPADAMEKTEWVFARLMYPPISWGGRRRFFGGGDWRQGFSFWTMDYPLSDRHFSRALRRLTRIHTRSVEQPVNLDDGDDVFYWPWLYAVEAGHWDLSDAQAKKLREYLLRGGFLMTDDFHGTQEWEIFTASMRRVFPERPIVEIEDRDSIFHVLYDLDDRYQVPGAQFLRSGRTYEYDGVTARWRGIYDDQGRLMVAMCHNMDLGDSWEHADNPRYPEKYSALGIRIGVNYVIYAMTH
ncbi:MAG: DUF4159 domain-containing protein [Acidobacteria bacterium]|nr:DUF4159 domain-containing protein [Acidobacteriota bacterium]MBI3473618.1 DUF4159 domain-containing protein [Candidatus Solibacter usitatus]